jgi:glycine cleavage system transcriptional repressor
MENLLITTIAQADSKVFSELSRLAGLNECHIHYSHLHALGSYNSITLQISGNWSGIAKIESALPAIANRLSIDLVSRRLPSEKIERFHLPYQIEIVAVDSPGIVYEITDFLNNLEVPVQRLETRSSKHQQTPLLTLDLQIDIPADSNIADIREQFLVFCDELNLDGTMEPRKC